MHIRIIGLLHSVLERRVCGATLVGDRRNNVSLRISEVTTPGAVEGLRDDMGSTRRGPSRILL